MPSSETTSVEGRIFLSTPSARRATSFWGSRVRRKVISIHALREEGDTPDQTPCSTSENFYPRPPRGGRRRAYCDVDRGKAISIHALREEGDPLMVAKEMPS